MITIDIYGDRWEVDVLDSHDPALFVEGEPCRGAAWLAKQSIALSNELDKRTARRVIIHELTHAYLWSTQGLVPRNMSEEFVCNFLAAYADDILSKAYVVYDNFFGGVDVEGKR